MPNWSNLGLGSQGGHLARAPEVCLIGVDCATDPRRVGLARADWDGRQVTVGEVTIAARDCLPAQVITAWIPPDLPCLLALDAPLGWPEHFGGLLARHRAGEPLEADPNHFFRRETDRFVAFRTGRRPLDVGAERIARTALAALQLLEGVVRLTGRPVPLAWQPEDLTGLAAIEVYPAGTLRICGCPSSGYKEDHQGEIRREILVRLKQEMALPEDCSLPLTDANALDALVCILAGADFLSGRAMPPENLAQAQKEGWIWVRGSTPAHGIQPQIPSQARSQSLVLPPRACTR